MMNPEQIPDEVVEAAAIADYEAWRDWADLRADTLDWELIEEEVQEEHRISARASIAAALNAWPVACKSESVLGLSKWIELPIEEEQ